MTVAGPSVDPAAARVREACPICSDGQAPERHRLREMLFGTREPFDYLRCRACGALRIATIPDDLSPYYPADYYAESAAAPGPALRRGGWGLASLAGAARDRKVLLGRGGRRARWLGRWAPPLSPAVRRTTTFTRKARLRTFGDPILDVGCGRRATYLANLQAVGFRNLLGIDPFLTGDGEFEGIPLRRQSIHEVTGSFQVITFNHSFEHVPDPQATMLSAAQHLRPGGVVLIRTPVMGTWFWERFGRDWWELDAPRHLFVHTQASLERLAAEAGMSLLDVVWDSSILEIIASDQISRDIAWREPASWLVAPPAGFDDATLDAYRAQVAELNASGRAGRAGFYFARPAAL